MYYGLPAGTYMVLQKEAYGLTSAPRRWYQTLAKWFQEAGFSVTLQDPALWVLREPSNGAEPGRLLGLAGVHVDDFVLAGSGCLWESKMEQLKQSFTWGVFESAQSEKPIRLLGLEVRQLPDFSVEVTQTDYIDRLPASDIARRVGGETPLDEKQISQLRRVVGALMWTGSTSPTAFAAASLLASQIPNATATVAREADRAVRLVQARARQAWRFHPSLQLDS